MDASQLHNHDHKVVKVWVWQWCLGESCYSMHYISLTLVPSALPIGRSQGLIRPAMPRDSNTRYAKSLICLIADNRM